MLCPNIKLGGEGAIERKELSAEEKKELMRKLGKKQLVLQLHSPLPDIPAQLNGYGLALSDDFKHARAENLILDYLNKVLP